MRVGVSRERGEVRRRLQIDTIKLRPATPKEPAASARATGSTAAADPGTIGTVLTSPRLKSLV
jgi:hypothetical protein